MAWVQDLFDRQYWVEAGSGPHPETARKGCAWFIRHKALGESHVDIATREGTNRQTVAQRIEAFLRYAPGAWRDVLQLSERANAALEARCSLAPPVDEGARRLKARELARRGMPEDHLVRLTGLSPQMVSELPEVAIAH